VLRMMLKLTSDQVVSPSFGRAPKQKPHSRRAHSFD
jgi:hypothetical protein